MSDQDINADLDALLDAAEDAQFNPNPIKVSLARSIRDTLKLQQRLQELQDEFTKKSQEFVRYQGQQEAFWSMFLDGRKYTADEAIEANLDGIKDAVEATT